MAKSKGDDSTQGENPRPPADDLPTPQRIGRYRIQRILGVGSFGAVYLANDETLHREVAIKVPRLRHVGPAAIRDDWMAEAQVVAGLDHPHIVPVYDVGATADHPFFVVSKLISGSDLRSRMLLKQPAIVDAVRWVAAVADALNYAHVHGLVHRDIKPSNILIDADNHPWLTDFGLALREADLGKGPTNAYVGTFHYMSPEQARGEGHLVDGRADIFSLGIVLYELLTGIRPFRGESSRQLLTNIVRAEPRALRVRVPDLPVEIERICLKALAKRVSDRYSTAMDMADDLRQFASVTDSTSSAQTLNRVEDTAGEQDTVIRVTDSTRATTIVPKGLRAFDEHDQNFFLRLVPGPRNIDGIPEIILRWKTHIESEKIDETFRVGLVYGASGSGKSSLIRAGLIPHLNSQIHIAYVESTSTDTERRLLHALPEPSDVSNSDSLVAKIASLRQDRTTDRKVLIVLDQFEQWLHTHHELHECQLVDALRQCDGLHVQCIVLIRDDFWMDATRFFHELDIRLIDGVNSAPVDRFDRRHARFVLSEFGRAYGCLPDDSRDHSPAQKKFLDQVIDSVQEDGKVISIHLALLAQMLRGREWIPATLSQFGGTDGIGVDFLNATFSTDSASPLHRSLQEPARAVLGKLLPDAGTNIKGQMQSAADLRRACELDEKDFLELIDVLDGQLRLITPTVGPESSGTETKAWFQLTHDFLVPSLRSWLTQKQRETASGRAKLRMQELTQLWRHKPESRYLPDVFEFTRMAMLTHAASRSKEEAKMMSAAARHHLVRWAAVAALLAAVVVGVKLIQQGLAENARYREAGLLVNQLLAARVDEVPEVLGHLAPVALYARPRLDDVLGRPGTTEHEKLRIRMALLQNDPQQIRLLSNFVPEVSSEDLILLTEVLNPHADSARDVFSKKFESEDLDELSWLKVAYLLAAFDPDHIGQGQYSERLAETLVNQNAMRVSKLSSGFASIAETLVHPLAEIFDDPSRSYQQRINAAVVLLHCCQGRDRLLSDLICTALPAQFEILLPIVESNRDSLLAPLHAELQQSAKIAWPEFSEVGDDAVDPQVREAFESATGTITDTFAVCQDLPFSQFKTLAVEIQPFGYRPLCIRPYTRQDDEMVAAVWHRDGLQWHFSKNLRADQVEDEASTMRNRGLHPTDVTRLYGNPQQDDLFGVLWANRLPSVIDAKLYVGVPESEHSSAWGPLNDQGFAPKSNLKYHDSSGTPMYCSVRWKMRINPAYVDCWDDSEEQCVSRILDGWHHVDVRMTPGDQWSGGEPSIAATWWNGGPMETRRLDRSRLQDHLAQFAELRDSGYRPASISVITLDDGPQAVSLWHRPVISEVERDRIASRQANAVIALYQLGETATLWPLLEHRDDPRLRSFLIDRLASLGASPLPLVERLIREENTRSQQFAIIAALSKYRVEQLSAESASELQTWIERVGTTDASAALHSIGRHLCQRWQWQESEQQIAAAQDPASAGEDAAASDDDVTWRRSGDGQTMATIIGPIELQMGSPGSEAFRDHALEITRRVRIPRSFAIATTEVTVEQYGRFDPGLGYAGDYTPSDNCPTNMVSWFDAVRYCRWLCDQEDMDEADKPYPPLDEIKPGVTFPRDFLSRSGYRLPTAAEWEYACRAQSHTPRPYGHSEEILRDYAWTVDNSHYQLHPVGTLLPNDFGLFDLLGNAMEWVHDRHGNTSNTTEQIYVDDGQDDRTINESIRISRGGAFLYSPSSARSASKERGGTSSRHPYRGFRIARTIPE